MPLDLAAPALQWLLLERRQAESVNLPLAELLLGAVLHVREWDADVQDQLSSLRERTCSTTGAEREALRRWLASQAWDQAVSRRQTWASPNRQPPTRDQFEQVSAPFPGNPSKPLGGFWTTASRIGPSPWSEFQRNTGGPQLVEFDVEVHTEGVLEVRTRRDWHELCEGYRLPNPEGSDSLDWARLSSQCRGIHLTSRGLAETYLRHKPGEQSTQAVRWDVESTLWFEWPLVEHA